MSDAASPQPLSPSSAGSHRASSPPLSTKPLIGEALHQALVSQLEWYFSRENLQRDSWLLSQLSVNGWVSVDVICSFRKVQHLTSDRDTVIGAMKACKSITFDPTETSIRPSHRAERNTLILRDMTSSLPVEQVRGIFDSPDCPGRVINLRADIGDCWFVVFSSEIECMDTALWLTGQTFQGKQIYARVKSVAVNNPVTQATQSLQHTGNLITTPLRVPQSQSKLQSPTGTSAATTLPVQTDYNNNNYYSSQSQYQPFMFTYPPTYFPNSSVAVNGYPQSQSRQPQGHNGHSHYQPKRDRVYQPSSQSQYPTSHSYHSHSQYPPNSQQPYNPSNTRFSNGAQAHRSHSAQAPRRKKNYNESHPIATNGIDGVVDASADPLNGLTRRKKHGSASNINTGDVAAIVNDTDSSVPLDSSQFPTLAPAEATPDAAITAIPPPQRQVVESHNAAPERTASVESHSQQSSSPSAPKGWASIVSIAKPITAPVPAKSNESSPVQPKKATLTGEVRPPQLREREEKENHENPAPSKSAAAAPSPVTVSPSPMNYAKMVGSMNPADAARLAEQLKAAREAKEAQRRAEAHAAARATTVDTYTDNEAKVELERKNSQRTERRERKDAEKKMIRSLIAKPTANTNASVIHEQPAAAPADAAAASQPQSQSTPSTQSQLSPLTSLSSEVKRPLSWAEMARRKAQAAEANNAVAALATLAPSSAAPQSVSSNEAGPINGALHILHSS